MKNNMIMKKYTLLCALGSILYTASSCTDDDVLEKITPAEDGSEIIFGARAGFENGDPASRTEYAGEEGYYEIDGTKYERIDWISTDMIEIYCSEAANVKNSHYKITSTTGNEETSESVGDDKHANDFATLVRIGDSSMQWNGDIDHTFYSMYPSSMMFTDNPDETLETGVFLDKKTVTGIVPVAQTPINVVPETIDGVVHYVAKPNMNYAYMVAKSVGNRLSKPNVDLTFMPIVTAVEINLTLPTTASEDVSIAEIQIEGDKIAGGFTTNLESWDGTSYPTCLINENVETSNVIQIPLWQGNEETGYTPLPIQKGGSLTFTVFLLPTTDVTSLKVSLSDTGAGYTSKTLEHKNNTDEVKVAIAPAHKKTLIKGLNMPTPFVVDASNWMGQLSNNEEFGNLSIPGTGGSFSYGYTPTTDKPAAWYQQQTLEFDDQWKLGIRAFEIVSDRLKDESEGNYANDGGQTLGDVYVKCSNTSVGITVGAVMDKLVAKLTEYPNECAALIFTYQPEGDASYPRDGEAYVSNLCDFLTKSNFSNYLEKYSPLMKMSKARGKILVIVRPTQLDEDSSTEITAATNAVTDALKDKILIVEGCGTGKDKWARRGYYAGGNPAPDIVPWGLFTGFTSNQVEYYLEQYLSNFSYKWRDYNVSCNSDAVSFAYDVSLAEEETFYQIWFQEWARVAKSDIVKSREWLADWRWYESYKEKLNHVKDAFDRAIKDKTGKYVYVNSLCGYFIDTKIDLSCEPFGPSHSNGGTAGDIAGLAKEINDDFYNHVLQVGINKETGPIGIVLMDYVSNSQSANGSYFLPGVIISNNFKSSLK